MKRALGFLAILMALTLVGRECSAEGKLSGVRSWLCFYGAAFPAGNLSTYDLYVFQSTAHPDLGPLHEKGAKAVGYISAGELNKNDPNFQKISGEGILLEENKDWPGSFRADIFSDKWRDFVIGELIPAVLSQGFDGIFIDTIDVAQYLEETKKSVGAIQKAARLIREIRNKYPAILIVLNNGLFLLDDVGSVVDALVVEDVFTLYDFRNKRYQLATPQWTRERVAALKKFQDKFHKPVLSLDYLKPSDRKNIEAVAAAAKAQNFIPYISDIGLQKIFFHP